MRISAHFRTPVALAAVLATTLAAGVLRTSAASPKFFNDDPLRVEPETQDASGVTPSEVDLFVDLTSNVIRGFRQTPATRALNLNTVDEVPDSSWFTNRAGARELTAEQIARGPNTSDGPAAGTWTITSSKSDGVTPGFTVKDSTGQRWFLKFDPPGLRGMSTGTEVAVTKLMWALGYNVPENHIAYLRREQLTVGAQAKFTPAGGRARQMRDRDIDQLLTRVDREPNGTYRVVASKAVAGTPVGRIRFAGTRPDDPNDVVPHEHRRELRGYGVFAAWLNHVDAKAINSLDTLVTENGRTRVRHHLIDFGSALGSGGVAPADYWAGDEYLLEPRQVAKQMIGFGFVYPKWHTAEFYEAAAIGRLQAEQRDFDPESWKPRVPNQAFLHARLDDKFWAARKLAALNTSLIRAAVHTGEFGDAEAEEFLVRALAERRDAILRTYLPALNPISDVALSADGTLTFTNAAVDADVARAPRHYRAMWSRFDNATQTATEIAETVGDTTMRAPLTLPRLAGTFVKVQISAIDAENPAWAAPVDAYFHAVDGQWLLVGFERMTDR